MVELAWVGVVWREWIGRENVERVPESDALMTREAQVSAYASAAGETGVMAPTHLFHTAQACEILRPGDRVLDLGCGPARQVAWLARLNPDVSFVGVDLSEPMLTAGLAHLAGQNLANVELRRADITDLSQFDPASFDAVVSSMSLHHLPDLPALQRCAQVVGRVLKPGGGVYLADFGRLRSKKSMVYFASRTARRQSTCFTHDYLSSLQAAFSVRQMKALAPLLSRQARAYAMFPAPFLQVIKSPPRRERDLKLRQALREDCRGLSQAAQDDLRNLIRFFRFGGLRTSLLE